MADIARLGIEIDSTGVETASARLVRFKDISHQTKATNTPQGPPN